MGGRSQTTEHEVLLDCLPAVVYIAEPGESGAWLYVSQRIESMLGFPVEEWLADPDLWVRRLHPEDRDVVLTAENTRAANELSAPSALEYRMIHRDGHAVWIRDDAVLVADDDGPLRWHGVLSDITAQKEAQLELQRRAAGQAAVARLGEHALERVSIGQLMEEAIAAAADVLQVETALFGGLVADGTLVLRTALGWPGLEPGIRLSNLDPNTQPGRTHMTGESVIVEDWNVEDRFRNSELLRARGIRSSITVRVSGPDAPFGILSVLSTSPRAYSAGDIDFLQSLANVLADALERQERDDAIQHQALHDPLTGLPNRVLFMDRLEQAFERVRGRDRSLAAVLFIDVDHFKQVNDNFGHHAGDELLVGVATRLREAVRPTDTVARFGGDEFGLLVENITSERDAIATAERIAAGFARPFVLDAGSHFVTASIGIALADGREQPTDLLRDSDAAMYRAKDRGRARYEMFDEDMRARAIARLRLEDDLHRAIDHDQLRLAYQPVLMLSDESIAGVEALLRWDHPQRGPVPPNEFVPIAEEAGLIERIGQWVLEEACRDATRWGTMVEQPFGVAVNLSTLQLVSGRFPEMLRKVLAKSELEPARLRLEITEDMLHDEADATLQTLLALDAIGVKLIIDDFGRGYSSLSQLSRLPLAGLKVDRRFVAALGQDAAAKTVADTVVAIGRTLSIGVIGEGAETPEQARILRELGCDLVQGYLYSPAVSAAEITRMLTDGAVLRRTLD